MLTSTQIKKAIKNIKLDRNSDNSAATVGMVKELIPFTKNALYRAKFSEFYDFSDANSYKITRGTSGVTYTGLNQTFILPQKI